MKLHMGCGFDIRDGYLNLDILPLSGVDVVADIELGTLPFRANAFDQVAAFNFLEHLADLPHVMKETHRILKPQGIAHIRVPHFTHRGAYGDPTHKRFFSYDTFFYFVTGFRWNYMFDFGFSGIKTRLIFAKGKQIYNWIVEPLANRFPVTYELTFLRALFPAHQVEAFLTK
jgi:SAM-dependent methyltransferase